MLKLVPFNAAWITHDKIDIHAIYRRPRFVEDEFGEMQREYDSNGLPTWDLTGPLPVKQHNKWEAKGFQYVTLANRGSLYNVARTGTLMGGTIADYDQHQTGGPWNYRKYVAGQQTATTAEVDQLRRDVDAYGPEAVEHLRRRHDPNFVLPVSLRETKKSPPSAKAAGRSEATA